jgi:hypothetical protein
MVRPGVAPFPRARDFDQTLTFFMRDKDIINGLEHERTHLYMLVALDAGARCWDITKRTTSTLMVIRQAWPQGGSVTKCYYSSF